MSACVMSVLQAKLSNVCWEHGGGACTRTCACSMYSNMRTSPVLGYADTERTCTCHKTRVNFPYSESHICGRCRQRPPATHQESAAASGSEPGERAAVTAAPVKHHNGAGSMRMGEHWVTSHYFLLLHLRDQISKICLLP